MELLEDWPLIHLPNRLTAAQEHELLEHVKVGVGELEACKIWHLCHGIEELPPERRKTLSSLGIRLQFKCARTSSYLLRPCVPIRGGRNPVHVERQLRRTANRLPIFHGGRQIVRLVQRHHW